MYIDSRAFSYISTVQFIHVVSNCSSLIFLLLCNIHLLSIGQYSHLSVHVVILLMGTLFIDEVTDDAVVNIWVCFLMWICMSFSRELKLTCWVIGRLYLQLCQIMPNCILKCLNPFSVSLFASSLALLGIVKL